MPGINASDLNRSTSTLDQALYVASCFADAHGRQWIYGTTHRELADRTTGECYMVLDEGDRLRPAYEADDRWRLEYRLDRGPKERETFAEPMSVAAAGSEAIELEPVEGLIR